MRLGCVGEVQHVRVRLQAIEPRVIVLPVLMLWVLPRQRRWVLRLVLWLLEVVVEVVRLLRLFAATDIARVPTRAFAMRLPRRQVGLLIRAAPMLSLHLKPPLPLLLRRAAAARPLCMRMHPLCVSGPFR